jgi:hypothetical protein
VPAVLKTFASTVAGLAVAPDLEVCPDAWFASATTKAVQIAKRAGYLELLIGNLLIV